MVFTEHVNKFEGIGKQIDCLTELVKSWSDAKIMKHPLKGPEEFLIYLEKILSIYYCFSQYVKLYVIQTVPFNQTRTSLLYNVLPCMVNIAFAKKI